MRFQLSGHRGDAGLAKLTLVLSVAAALAVGGPPLPWSAPAAGRPE